MKRLHIWLVVLAVEVACYFLGWGNAWDAYLRVKTSGFVLAMHWWLNRK